MRSACVLKCFERFFRHSVLRGLNHANYSNRRRYCLELGDQQRTAENPNERERKSVSERVTVSVRAQDIQAIGKGGHLCQDLNAIPSALGHE